jgi:hypothetical protein
MKPFLLSFLNFICLFLFKYSDMITWPVARQRLRKHVNITRPIAGNGYGQNNVRIVGNGVLYKARAEVI